jgi:hypothetical protein
MSRPFPNSNQRGGGAPITVIRCIGIGVAGANHCLLYSGKNSCMKAKQPVAAALLRNRRASYLQKTVCPCDRFNSFDPRATVLGGMLFSFINPEIAAGHPNYERNYRRLALAGMLAIWASWLVNMGLGLLCCFLLLKSKKQSYAWMSLAVLGPFGIMILATLQDKGSLAGDLCQQFVGKLKFYLRVPLELCFFVLMWTVAYQTVILISNLSIMCESVVTGRTIAEIIDIRDASSGMWAFSEALEIMYLMVLFYLLRPICFNAIWHLPKLWASVKEA